MLTGVASSAIARGAHPGHGPPRTMSRAARPWTPLERIDTALMSLAVKLWSELLGALALAGQCAAGVRCPPPDRPEEDEAATPRPSTDPGAAVPYPASDRS